MLQDARISNLAKLSSLMVTTKQPRLHVLTEAQLMARKTVFNLFASAKRANANGTTAKKICQERTCSNGSVAKLMPMLKNQPVTSQLVTSQPVTSQLVTSQPVISQLVTSQLVMLKNQSVARK